MHKEVLFLTKSGLTKSYKGLIFISEKAWTPCFRIGFVKKEKKKGGDRLNVHSY